MFGGLLFTRLRAAEQAMRRGRIDEAYRLAGEPDVAAHPRGATVRAGLGKAFLDRARAHYRAERFTEALFDLNRAQQCGGPEADIETLRRQVLTVADEVARQAAERRKRVEEARRRVDAGSLAAGRRMLESAPAGDDSSEELKKEIAKRQRQAEEALTRVETLMKQGQTADAIERLVDARRLDAHSERAARLETQLCDRVVAEARDALLAGRVTLAHAALERIAPLTQKRSERASLEEVVALTIAAARAMAANDFAEAQRLAHRIRSLLPKAGWANQACKSLDQIDDALLALRSGPLGEAPAARPAGQTPTAAAALQETVMLGNRAPVGAPSFPERLLLLIDGGGSFLLHAGQRVSIGRAASGNPADVPVYSDLSERHAELARVEEDYFLFSGHEVEIGHRRTRQQLLKDGDRMVLGRRAKFTFRTPNRKSATATLDVSDSTKMPNDVRRVVLFRQTAMIGRGPSCHIPCTSAQRDLVLFERGGRLWIRPSGRGANAPAEPVEMGKPIEMEGVSLTVKPWTAPPAGASRLV